jgi:hypothetical protein
LITWAAQVGGQLRACVPASKRSCIQRQRRRTYTNEPTTESRNCMHIGRRAVKASVALLAAAVLGLTGVAFATSASGDTNAVAFNGFELGPDQAWYSASVESALGAAHTGVGALKVSTTGAWGSGVQTSNWPGYAGIVAGTQYDASVWYREDTATMPTVTWTLRWTDSSGNQVGTSPVSMPRATVWTQASATVTAPVGATHLRWTYTWAAPAAGPAFLLDDESVTTH